MVSLKRSVKVFCTVICYCFLFCACIYAQTLDKPITECSGYSESKVSCTRDLPDGTKQSGSGWCKCVRGMYQGGCSLPAYSYTETRYSSKTGQQCLDCTVPGVVKGCGTISQIVDETPSCGEWYSCGGTPIVKECTSGQVEYMPIEPCGTSERKCCSDGTWSGWGKSCSTVIQCSGNSSETCGVCGTRTRTCNTSTGQWSAWGPCVKPTCEWGGIEGGIFAMTESEIAAEFGDYVWIDNPRGSCSCEQKNKTGIVNRGTQNGYIMVAGPVYCSCS